MQPCIVLAPPCFNRKPKARLCVPVGLEPEYVAAYQRLYSTPANVWDMQRMEWMAIWECLEQSGQPYRIVVPQSRSVHLDAARHARPGANVRWPLSLVPDSHPAVVGFPRDLAMHISANRGFLRLDAVWDDTVEPKLVRSIYGEGGRVYIAGGRAVIQSSEVVCVSGQNVWAPVPLNELIDAGLSVVQMPVGAFREIASGESVVSEENHIDRWQGVWEDHHGGVHVVAPASCRAFGSQRALMSATETQERISSECHRVGITYHSLKKLNTPASVGFVQLPSRHVIMTQWEPKLERLLVDVLGREYVLVTKVPIVAYPIYSNAGIRCLVGVVPDCLVTPVN